MHPERWRLRWYQSDAKVRWVDAAVIFLVTVVTNLTNLAIAVAVGLGISLLSFAWDSGRQLRVRRRLDTFDTEGRLRRRVYELEGPLFFGSSSALLEVGVARQALGRAGGRDRWPPPRPVSSCFCSC